MEAGRTDVRPALDGFGSPQAIAVVGASGDPATIAGLLFGNLVDSGFGGVVLPVNPHHAEVRGITAFPDLASCPVTPGTAESACQDNRIEVSSIGARGRQDRGITMPVSPNLNSGGYSRAANRVSADRSRFANLRVRSQ